MKRILTLMLAAAMVISMAACGEKKTDVVESTKEIVEEVIVVEDTTKNAPTDEVAGEQDIASEGAGGFVVPELDGYTKMDADGTTIYTSEDGKSVITIASTPATAEQIADFASKNEETIGKELSAMLAQIPGAEATGKFDTVEGKDAYVVEMTIAKDEATGVLEDTTVTAYTFPVGDSFVAVSSMTTGGGDAAAEAKKLIAAL